MTKKHFIDAAAIVRNILQGEWTNEPPVWADSEKYDDCPIDPVHGAPNDAYDSDYTRAVQTAEAFVMLFTQHNDRFDTQRFLIACGLVTVPLKTTRQRS